MADYLLLDQLIMLTQHTHHDKDEQDLKSSLSSLLKLQNQNSGSPITIKVRDSSNTNSGSLRQRGATAADLHATPATRDSEIGGLTKSKIQEELLKMKYKQALQALEQLRHKLKKDYKA